MIDIENLKDTYDSKLSKYEQLGIELKSIFSELLEVKNIHSITYRVKEINSLVNKIVDKEKYQTLTDITDLCGIRIITNLESEITEVATVLRRHFLIDEENSCDHRNKAANDFGYMSLHLVLSLGPDRGNLPGNKTLKSLKAEVQIRSILQHAWAEIEHDLGYKSKEAIPEELKRGSNRLSAILEAADLEFVRLKELKLAHIRQATQAITPEAETKTSIDRINITVLDEHSKVLDAIRNMLSDKFQVRFTKKGNYSNLFPKFDYFGLKYLEELEGGLNKNSSALFRFVELLFERRNDSPKYIRSEAPLEYYLHFLGSAKDEVYWDNYRCFGSEDCSRSITEVTDFIQLHKDSIE